MSRILKRNFQAKHKMPNYKVMGAVSPDTMNKLTDLTVNKNTAVAQDIVTAITQVLKANITGMAADAYTEPFETDWLNRLNYQTPSGIFYLISEGDASICFPREEVKIQPGKVYFVDERQTFKIQSLNKTRVCLISGKFLWDKDIHGE
jgi:mannose-6-phosphate isomerase-like protein (cupin superfamily)